jgi:hypothetical protein
MSSAIFSLATLEHTGFPHDETLMGEGTGAEYNRRAYLKAVSAIVFPGLLTFAPFNNYHWPAQEETIITVTQLQQRFATDSLGTNFKEIQTAQEQVAQLRACMGFNILELATVLRVSRPTIYDWIESNTVAVNKKNQQRLNQIYKISKEWEAKHLGQLGSYLHKPIEDTDKSLFDLLKSNKLDSDKIHYYLDNIAQVILKKRKEDEAREALLRKHDFEPVSKDDMEDRLNDIYFLD